LKITVLGAGSWGSAISKVLSLNGHDVKVWTREEKIYNAFLNGENPYYLPGITLPRTIKSFLEIDKSIEGSEVIVNAIPAQFTRSVMKQVGGLGKKLFVNLAKGIEIESGMLINQIFFQETNSEFYCTLSGPSHAEEVARDIPTTVVACSKDVSTAEFVQKVFSNASFRVYTNSDVSGVEICGALKNIYAIACGIIDGFGTWDNSKAALITRSMVELARYGENNGAKKDTFFGLAGVGDMIVTCTSLHSRNRHVGEMIGKGKSLNEIIESMNQVAEGVYTSKALHRILKERYTDMPIAEKIYSILYESYDPKKAISDLMNRELKAE